MKFTQQQIDSIRQDFPILHQEVNGYPLVYFDNAASAQKPKAVIDTVSHYYSFEHSNIHRGVHHLSAEATVKYEGARKTIQVHINAAHDLSLIHISEPTRPY